jgi:hypothetical protein
MILCEKIASICNIINQKLCCYDDENNRVNYRANYRSKNRTKTRENDRENDKKDRAKDREKDRENDKKEIRSINDFNTEDQYDNYLIENDLLCIICFEPLLNNVKNLRCHHKYHIKCLNEWRKYKKKCPVCKINVL